MVVDMCSDIPLPAPGMTLVTAMKPPDTGALRELPEAYRTQLVVLVPNHRCWCLWTRPSLPVEYALVWEKVWWRWRVLRHCQVTAGCPAVTGIAAGVRWASRRLDRSICWARTSTRLRMVACCARRTAAIELGILAELMLSNLRPGCCTVISGSVGLGSNAMYGML